MAESATNAELMQSLRRLVRGLSALFWTLPLTLLVCVQSAVTDWLRPFGAAPPIVATGMLLYGLRQLKTFQKQERIWQSSLDRGQLLALINFGLSPFIYWWNRFPFEFFFSQAVLVLSISSILFLLSLNQILRRLAAMLPDETLRAEVAFFTSLNINLILTSLGLGLAVFLLNQLNTLPQPIITLLDILLSTRRVLMLFLLLLPLAMTMTLVWKTKEAVLASVFTKPPGDA